MAHHRRGELLGDDNLLDAAVSSSSPRCGPPSTPTPGRRPTSLRCGASSRERDLARAVLRRTHRTHPPPDLKGAHLLFVEVARPRLDQWRAAAETAASTESIDEISSLTAKSPKFTVICMTEPPVGVGTEGFDRVDANGRSAESRWRVTEWEPDSHARWDLVSGPIAGTEATFALRAMAAAPSSRSRPTFVRPGSTGCSAQSLVCLGVDRTVLTLPS